jgi:hypothetical protein
MLEEEAQHLLRGREMVGFRRGEKGATAAALSRSFGAVSWGGVRGFSFKTPATRAVPKPRSFGIQRSILLISFPKIARQRA